METRWRFRDPRIAVKIAGPKAKGQRSIGRGRAPAREPTARMRADSGRRALQEKRDWSGAGSVPETDTGRRGEEPQARERPLVKELGKIPP